MNLSVMAQHRKNSFEKGFGMISVRYWNLTGLFSESQRLFSRKVFKLISAWCLNLAPKGANLTGLIFECFRYGSALQRLFRERFWDDLCWCWNLNPLNS